MLAVRETWAFSSCPTVSSTAYYTSAADWNCFAPVSAEPRLNGPMVSFLVDAYELSTHGYPRAALQAELWQIIERTLITSKRSRRDAGMASRSGRAPTIGVIPRTISITDCCIPRTTLHPACSDSVAQASRATTAGRGHRCDCCHRWRLRSRSCLSLSGVCGRRLAQPEPCRKVCGSYRPGRSAAGYFGLAKCRILRICLSTGLPIRGHWSGEM